jgi:hypothetical protein
MGAAAQFKFCTNLVSLGVSFKETVLNEKAVSIRNRPKGFFVGQAMEKQIFYNYITQAHPYMRECRPRLTNVRYWNSNRVTFKCTIFNFQYVCYLLILWRDVLLVRQKKYLQTTLFFSM